jgi:F0F1-type ATP synthase membrane subunit b/b'
LRKLQRLSRLPWFVLASLSLVVAALAPTVQARGIDQAPATAQPVEPKSPPAPATDPSHAPTDRAAAPAHQPAPSHDAPAAGEHEAEEHGESPWALVARIFNFLILAGGLVYFLRSPVAQHLAARGQEVRAGLVSARETTDRAQRQLSEIDRRLKELPAEIEALRTRGAQEVAAEGVRIKQQAEAERHRLLEESRRDLDIQVRLAKRALTEYAASLAVQLASDQIERTITPDDQTRLIDRYVARVKEIHG